MYDLIVIGGGINGTAIACDAAGRGLSVLLVEKDDLANHTSSASSKLIHGGLRYLEQREFNLVKASLREREIMLFKAPHVVWPLQFIMPHKRSIRPAWIIRLGLFLYDHLAGRQKLAPSKSINLHTHPAGESIQATFKKGFIYSDCWGDDARLVVLNAQHATQLGATIKTRTKCIRASRDHDHWKVTIQSTGSVEQSTVRAKALINAAGPWVDTVLSECAQDKTPVPIQHVKGSHIVVPQIHSDRYAYILQNNDQRVLFVIPYLEKYSLIGTTDVTYHKALDNVSINQGEIDYLCQGVNHYFEKSICPEDIIWSYAGVRTLRSDKTSSPSKMSREYQLTLEDQDGLAPLLCVYGGKITTHRTLAEHVMEKIKSYFPEMGNNWTHNTPLPGGNIPNAHFDDYLLQLYADFPTLSKTLLHRYARLYGTCCEQILFNIKKTEDLGTHFGADLYQKELEYLVENEFVQTADDILWRRTKLGITFPKNHITLLEKAITTHLSKTKKQSDKKNVNNI